MFITFYKFYATEEDYQSDLAAEQRKLDEIQQQINNLSRDTSLAGQLKLQDLLEQYQEQSDVISNMIRDHEKEQGSNRFDEEMDKLDQELEDMTAPETMAALVKDALLTGMVTIGDEIVNLDNLMASFAVESEGAITALSNTIRAEMIDSLKEASLLVQQLGANYAALSGIGASLPNARSLNNVQTNTGGRSVEFNAPILNIEGSVGDNIQGQLQEWATQVQNSVMNTVSRALSTI